jgi:hypothetical protein
MEILTWFRLAYEQRDSQGVNEYIIMTREGLHAGLLSFKVVGRSIHIVNVYVHEPYRKEIQFTKWLKQFDHIYAYRVVISAIPYWEHIGAKVVNTVKEPFFLDMVFEESEFE